MPDAEVEAVDPHAGLKKTERDKLVRMGKAFDRIDALLLRLAQQGLQRMTPSSQTELQALGQTAHNAALITIERELDHLQAHVQRYLDRDPLFTMDDYMTTINRIWLLNNAVRRRHAAGQTPAQMEDINGLARRRYDELDTTLKLQPVGASGWVTDTDFVGITVYFYADGHETLFQASNCKPTMYFGSDPKRLLNQPISDYVSYSISEVSHGAFSFDHAKVSNDGRLSLHRDLVVKKAPWFGARAYNKLAARNWIELTDRLRARQSHPVHGGANHLVYVEPSGYGKLVEDAKTAHASMELLDDRGAPLFVDVPMRAENNLLLDNLGRFHKKGSKLQPDGLFGRAWVAGGQLRFFPLTGIYHESVNLKWRRSGSGQQLHEIHLTLENLDNVSR